MINFQKTIKRERDIIRLFGGVFFVLTIFLFSSSQLAFAAERVSEQGRSWKDYLSIAPAILLLLFAFKMMLPRGGSRKGDNCNMSETDERPTRHESSGGGDGGGD